MKRVNSNTRLPKGFFDGYEKVDSVTIYYVAGGNKEIPVLALGGDHSGRLNNLKTMQSVAVNVKGGELKDCGHYTPEECPDEFLKQLIQFLE